MGVTAGTTPKIQHGRAAYNDDDDDDDDDNTRAAGIV